MADFPAPPTFAEPVITDERTGKGNFNPIWLNWFLQVVKLLEDASSGTIIEHNNLLLIQGGTPGEYYHLTAAQHTTLAAYDHEDMNGLLGGAAADHYHLTAAQHTILVAYDHEDMAGLLGGAANDHYHLTAAQHSTATGGPAQAVTNIAVGASPSTWQNTSGFNVVVSVNGLAGDTYAMSRDNVAFFPVGVGAALSLTVPRGDYLRVTYGGAAPALNYFAM